MPDSDCQWFVQIILSYINVRGTLTSQQTKLSLHIAWRHPMAKFLGGPYLGYS